MQEEVVLDIEQSESEETERECGCAEGDCTCMDFVVPNAQVPAPELDEVPKDDRKSINRPPNLVIPNQIGLEEEEVVPNQIELKENSPIYNGPIDENVLIEENGPIEENGLIEESSPS